MLLGLPAHQASFRVVHPLCKGTWLPHPLWCRHRAWILGSQQRNLSCSAWWRGQEVGGRRRCVAVCPWTVCSRPVHLGHSGNERVGESWTVGIQAGGQWPALTGSSWPAECQLGFRASGCQFWVLKGQWAGEKQEPPGSTWTHVNAFPLLSSILARFAWTCIFLSSGHGLLQSLSWCSVRSSASEDVFLMHPWREKSSTSTYISAILSPSTNICTLCSFFIPHVLRFHYSFSLWFKHVF